MDCYNKILFIGRAYKYILTKYEIPVSNLFTILVGENGALFTHNLSFSHWSDYWHDSLEALAGSRALVACGQSQ